VLRLRLGVATQNHLSTVGRKRPANCLC
jgi:hypothetical protein